MAASDNTNLKVAERLAQLGADLEAYDQSGTDAQRIVRNRINGDDDQCTLVTPEFNERVLGALE